MNTTLTERKNQAIKYLKQLKVYKPYIKGFEEENLTCFFERNSHYIMTVKPFILLLSFGIDPTIDVLMIITIITIPL